MIFSIIMVLTDGLRAKHAVPHHPLRAVPPGLITAGAVIYWFHRRSTNRRLDRRIPRVSSSRPTSAEGPPGFDQRLQEGGGDLYAVRQRGMGHLPVVFFSTSPSPAWRATSSSANLISIASSALPGHLHAMLAAPGQPKKVVEVELKAKGTPLHAASVVGDTVGDPSRTPPASR